MQKKLILPVTVLVIVIVGLFFFVGMKSVPSANVPAPVLPETSYVEHTPYYDIAANYASSTPLLASVGAAANDAAVTTMKNFISDSIVQFKTAGNFANLTPIEAQNMGLSSTTKETLQITYLIASSTHTVSYIFMTYEDTLGAHSSSSFRTFTFDTSTGAELSLSDIMAPGADYLDTLSSLSRAGLPAVIGDSGAASFIQSGTTPDETNFANFFFDNQDFVILFDPYQVAPYSDGPQTLRIPLSQLGSILKPEYQL